MKKTLLVAAVASFAAFSTGAEADMPNLGLCNKLLTNLDASCAKETGFVAQYQCKAGGYLAFGLCKTVTAGLGAEKGSAASSEVAEQCQNAADKAACDAALEKLLDTAALGVMKEMMSEEQGKFSEEMKTKLEEAAKSLPASDKDPAPTSSKN